MGTLSEISSNIRQARELSLLGNYESALTFYSCGLALIKKQLSTIKDYGRKQQWLQVHQEITQESELVTDITKTLASFTLDNKANGSRFSYNDAAEEPTRDPGVWPPPPPLEQRRPQPPSSLYNPPSGPGQQRSGASRRPVKEGPRNSGAGVINRGPSKAGPGSFQVQCFFEISRPGAFKYPSFFR